MADNSIRIDKFLRKQMSPKENEDFLNELRNNPELRKEAQITALMIKELQERQIREDAEIIEDVITSKRKAKIVKIRRVLSIAAMFILIFGVALLWNNKQSDTEALFNEYYTPYPAQGTPRSPFGTDSEVKEKLVTLFNQVGTAEDISPVIKELQAIYDSIDSDYEYSLYADDITWYLALAYLKNEEPEKAKDLLKLLEEKGYEKAIILIDKI